MKISKTFFLLTFIFFLSICKLCGQYVSYGTDPWGQRWQQISTPHFKLIYPKGVDSLAQRYAWLLDSSYTLGSGSIGHKPIRVPVVLHPDNVFSNGSVVWAPRRTELFTTPPSHSYPQLWDKQLALHELRHVAQIDKQNRGIMRAGYYLFGEQASALWLLPIPKWFLEGDAVATETGLSSSGRGRSPEFHMTYRTYFLSAIQWSYDRWINGSYKYDVPSIYHFGYQNVAYARKQYGTDIWDKVLNESGRRYFKLPAFGNALKKYTGLRVKDLQRETFNHLKQQWIEEDKLLDVDTAIRYITKSNNDYAGYRSVVSVSRNSFVVQKTSMDKASSIVMVNSSGEEKQLFNHGTINGRATQYRGKLYWSESVSDPRWEQRSYANIKSFDFETRKVKKHSRKGRYFALAFNDSLSYYAAASTSREGSTGICLLDGNNDNELKRYDLPKNTQVSELSWIDTNGFLAVLVLNDKGMGIHTLNTSNGEWGVLLPESYINISSISTYNGYIIFESGYSGINNIYALRVSSKKIYKVTSSRFGAFDALVSGNSIYFSDYQANGHRLAQKEANLGALQEAGWSTPYRFALAEMLSAQEGFNIDTITIPEGKLYESKPYRKLHHLFRIHSWVPLYAKLDSEFNFDPDELIQSIKPGFMLFSQNSLSTAVTRLGYSYEHGYNAGHASFTYKGWYPVIDITASYGGGKQTMVKDGVLAEGRENLYDIGTNIYIPLTFNGTRTLSGLIPQVGVKHSNNSYYVPSEDNYQSEIRFDLFLQQYIYSRSAVRDIYPRWGYRILLAHRSIPFDSENFGTMYGARLTVYTPGLFVNHGLKLSGSIQRQEVKRYYMSNLMPFPRGYSSFPSKELQLLTADYAFPIAYPDFNIGSLIYLKRLRLNLFADIGQNSYNGIYSIVKTDLFSYGIDIIADYHILRKEFPFMSGIRLIKPRNHGLSAEALFNVLF